MAVAVLLSELIALGCLIHLWRRRCSLGHKVFWSLALVVPIIGPLFFVVLERTPPRNTIEAPPYDFSRHGPG